MRRIFLILCVLWSLSARATDADTSGRRVVVDYPEALQKAGVKQVRCIFKDSRKFLWIGAENGLYRFDGTNVDLLEHEPGNLNTIPNNNIVSIAEDKAGNIWAGTLQGAARIDPWTLQCTVYNKTQHNLNDEFDLKIYCAADGKIWAGSGSGISLFDGKANRFNLIWYDRIAGEPNAGYVNYITDWKKDTLAAGTFHGIVLINKNNYHFRRVNPSPSPLTVIRLYVDGQKRIWMGTWGDGLIISDPDCKSFKTLKWEPHESQALHDVVTSIIHTNFYHQDRLWISTSRGVYELLNFKAGRSHCRLVPVSINPLDFANNIMVDDDQYIWVSAARVYRFFAGGSFFSTLPLRVDGIAQQLKFINAPGSKALAISSWYKSSGLMATDLNGRVIYRQPDARNQDAANISGVVQDKFRRLWISSLAGLSVLGPGFKPMPGALFTGRDAPSTVKTNGIAIDHDTVWLACYRHGIDLYDLNFHKIKSFAPFDRSGLTDNLFNGFFVDRSGVMWVFGDYNLYRYDRHKSTFKVYNFNNEATQFTVNDMAQMPDGNLLVASSTGLYHFNPATNVYKRISSPLLSRERQVQSVCIDANGDAWFTNNDKLVYYQVKTRHFTLFGKEDGLDNNEQPQWLATADGRTIYITEGNSVLTFPAENRASQARPIQLYIHSVQVNDSTINRALIAAHLELGYDENKLNLEFGAINYIKPGQNLYAYRLSKVDSRWVTTTDNFASYANLAPGKYIFTVKAENYAGVWSRPMQLQVNITPPFWATWEFRVMAGLLLFGAVFLVIRYVTQRNLREKILMLEKEKAVEQERNRIARDMHDDLGSGLTKIAVMSEVTKAQLSNRVSATEYLDEISTASRELVDNLQGIIWVLNPQNDSVESLVLYLKEYTEAFFEHTPVSLHFEYNDGFGHLSLSEEKRRNIFLVVKEACNNALKHSGGTVVSIIIQINKDVLTVTISDDGRGFDEGHVALFSNGLQNMKNRVRQIGGEFELISAPGHGARIVCRIPV